jgi:hypothetical protein
MVLTSQAKCNALESSLWELKVCPSAEISLEFSQLSSQALSNHYLPAVSRLIKIFEGDLIRKTYSLEDFVDETYQSVAIQYFCSLTSQLFNAEFNRKLKKEIPVEFQKPASYQVPDLGVWKFQ